MIQIDAVLNCIRPGAQWKLNGNSYEGLIWLSESDPPSLLEITQAWPTVQKELENKRLFRESQVEIKKLTQRYLELLAEGQVQMLSEITKQIQALKAGMNHG